MNNSTEPKSYFSIIETGLERLLKEGCNISYESDYNTYMTIRISIQDQSKLLHNNEIMKIMCSRKIIRQDFEMRGHYLKYKLTINKK